MFMGGNNYVWLAVPNESLSALGSSIRKLCIVHKDEHLSFLSHLIHITKFVRTKAPFAGRNAKQKARTQIEGGHGREFKEKKKLAAIFCSIPNDIGAQQHHA